MKCDECRGRGWVYAPCPDAETYADKGMSCTVLHTEPCPSCSR